MTEALLAGLLDSGVGPDQLGLIRAGRGFALDDSGEIAISDDVTDRLGHGSAMARLIADAAPGVALAVAKVFRDSFTTQPATIAAGLGWLVDINVRLVSMSFGLAEDREALRQGCTWALDHGVILVAAAPALGARCFPAAYDGVIAVTGDARCRPGEVSDLGGDRADFGTFCGRPDGGDGTPRIAGASLAAAHFAGLIGAYLMTAPSAGRAEVMAHFRDRAMLGEDPRRRRPRER